MDLSCFNISAEINSCGDVRIGDYKRVGLCIPYSDIIKSSIVYNGCKVNFNALPGAFAIYDKSNVPFNGTATTEEMGARFMKYNELVVFPAFEHTPENAYSIYRMSRGGERFVVILELEKPNATGTNRFQVFGLESGLRFKENKSDRENQTANLVSLEQINTSRPALYLFDTNDSTTITKVDNWLSYNLIYGGTIANGGTVKLIIDNDKTGYVLLPNGLILTTTAGKIDTTYTGIGGFRTVYVPKSNVGVVGINSSSIGGDITATGDTDYEFSLCPNLTGVIYNGIGTLSCVGDPLLATLIAPNNSYINATSCALTAKSIGDILYFAYLDDRQNVFYDFSGGTSASEGDVDTYLIATYGVDLNSIITVLDVTGSISIN